MVGDYYAAYLNEDAIEKRGLDPIKGELGEIGAIKDKTELSRVFGSQLRADVDPLNATNFYTDRLFGVFISADFNNPTKNVPYLLQGGLGLPDRDNYLNTDEHDKDLQNKYRAHIATILKLANIADADAKAQRIYDLETKIAQVHATREESGDVHKANNPWKTSDFATKAPGLDWNSYFKAAGLATEPMIMVWHPNAVTGISALVASAAARPVEGLSYVPRRSTVRPVCCQRHLPTRTSIFIERRSTACLNSSRVKSVRSTPRAEHSATS